MARNAPWRRTRTGWQAEIESWINRQSPDDLLNVDIFFDSIAVHGERGLGDLVWNHAYDLGHRSPSFWRALEGTLSGWQAPLGMLGGLRVGADGRVDLKLKGLFPIVAVARILSIKTGVPARSTAERLRRSAEAGAISEDWADSAIAAHQTLMGLILRQQLQDVSAGKKPGPRVDPGILGKAGVRAIREAVRLASDAVQVVREGMF